MLSQQQIYAVSEYLCSENILLSDLFCAYIDGFVGSFQLTGNAFALRKDFCCASTLNKCIMTLLGTHDTSRSMICIARNITTHQYIQEIGKLLSPAAGFQFNASRAASSQFESFSGMKMAKSFEELCPTLWQLLGVLLNGAVMQDASAAAKQQGDYLTEITYRYNEDTPAPANKQVVQDNPENPVVSEDFNDMPDEDWGGESEADESEDEEPLARPDSAVPNDRVDETKRWTAKSGTRWRKHAGEALQRQLQRTFVVSLAGFDVGKNEELTFLIQRRVTIFSIFMMNSNMRCNSLQSVVGLFAHSTNTSTKVIEMLSHAGLSIAPTSIDRMIRNMSDEAQKELKKQLPGMVTALAYDNLEIQFQTEQPTLTHAGKLASVTTATCIPLRPGVTKEDMRVSEELWKNSEFNPARLKENKPVSLSHEALMVIAAEGACAAEDERSVDSLYAWHMRDMLLNGSIDTIPAGLKEKFRRESLGEPLKRSSISDEKTTQKPMRTMNISVSSNSGNAAAMENMLQQGGATEEDLKTHVQIVHGDLGTGEKLRSLQNSRMIEDTPQDRLQFVLFVVGWFHTRMAMADAIWRLWIEPDKPRAGHPTHPLSIFHLCSLLRPREVGKISSGPGFRRTHNLIEHLLLATAADSWRLAVKAKHGVKLSEWKPGWDEVEALSHVVVHDYVANSAYRPARRPTDSADMVEDQLRLFNRDALLYMATTRASRYGDIRRMEDLLAVWVYIWRQVGKHRYATHIARFLANLNGGWPPRLAEIIRHNWLVNLTGKADGFRGVDWVVERNNFMHKCLHSGAGSNRTLANLIKESPLIMDFQNAHGIIERNFYLTERTVHHPPPLMKATLGKLQEYLQGENMNSHQAGRSLPHRPVNVIISGAAAGAASPGEEWFMPEGGSAEDGGEETVEGAGLSAADIAVDE